MRDAAKAVGIPVRTLYAHIQRKTLEARKLDGSTFHVKKSDVAQLADPGHTHRGLPDSPAVAAARERVAAKALEVQELSNEVAAERHRRELADVEAEREEKRQLIGLQVERERFALERERDAHRREEDERDARAQHEQRERAMQRQREEERRRQAEREQLSALQREAWLNRWVARAVRFIRAETGEFPDTDQAEALVRKALQRLQPSSPDELVEPVLVGGLRAEFGGAIERRASARRSELRLLLATAAALGVAGPGEMAGRILPAVVAAAETVDPQSPTGQVLIAIAARDAYTAEKGKRALAETLRQRDVAEQRRRQGWEECRLILRSLVMQALPLEATAKEIEEGVGILRERLEREARYGDPKEFERQAGERLWELQRRIRDRVGNERVTRRV